MKRLNFAQWALLALVAGGLLAGCTSFLGGQPRVTSQAPVNLQTPAQTAPVEPLLTPTPAFTPTPTEVFLPQALSALDCSYGGQLQALRALDANTVEFAFCQPEPAFLSKIAFPAFAIYPQEWLASLDSLDPSVPPMSNPPGSGPYQPAEWRRGEALSLQAFPAYWQAGKPAIPALTFRWSLDSGERLVELQAGTVQGIDNLAGVDYPAVQTDPALALVPRSPLSTLYLGLNNTHPPFDDPRVRQAIAMGVDRSRLVQETLPAGFQAADYFTPCALPDACEGEAWYPFDPEKARQLLAEAGYPAGFTSQLAYRDVVRSYLPQPGKIAAALRAQLKENLGISLKLAPMEEAGFLEQVDAGTLPGLYLLGWGADYPSAENFLQAHFGSQATLQFGPPSPELAALVQQASLQLDPQARRSAFAAVNDFIRQAVPAVPLAHGGWIAADSLAVAYSAGVQGAHASPLSLEDFSALSLDGASSFTWMQEEEPRSLYCGAAQDLASLRACSQIAETLYRYSTGAAQVEPGLATSCQPGSDLRTWTCTLRQGVRFHDNSSLDANDVVASLAFQWDAASPLHLGDSAPFVYFKDFWGAFLTRPAP